MALLLLAAIPGQRSDLQAEIAALEATGARVGVAVVDLAEVSVWFEHRAREVFLPASNQKLVTLAAALERLGADHEFVTRFALRAGEVVVEPAGDPNWTTGGAHDPERIVRVVAERLRSSGVEAVRDVRIEDRVFGAQARPDAWDEYDAALSYCPPTGGLVLDAGCFEVEVAPSAGQARVQMLAPAIELPIRGAIAMTADRAKGSVYGVAAAGDGLRAYGALWQKAGARTVRGAVPDGVALCARVLRQSLERAGIAVDAAAPARDRDDLFAYASPLLAAVEPMMKDSSNFHAEQVARALGAATRQDGTCAGACAAVADTLAALVGPWPDVVVDDGAGLSRRNRISPGCLATLLAIAASRPWGEIYVQSLPEGGEGTLRRRFRAPGQPAVRAKTGTLRDASALAGYVDRDDGRRLAFVILVNAGRKGTAAPARWRAAQDRIVVALAGLER